MSYFVITKLIFLITQFVYIFGNFLQVLFIILLFYTFVYFLRVAIVVFKMSNKPIPFICTIKLSAYLYFFVVVRSVSVSTPT